MSGGMTIELHPLVVMNVSDHLTRARYQHPQQKVRVIGALLGKQEGRVMEIVNTVEFAFKPTTKEEEGAIDLDDGFCAGRIEAYKKLFTDLDCIGWYSAILNPGPTADTPTLADVVAHKKMQRFTENPIYLIMNIDSQEAIEKKKLPFYLYEMNTMAIKSHHGFVKMDYCLATSDSERIAVEHVAKAIDPNAKTSVLSQHLQSTLNSIQILRKRIKCLIQLVKNSEEVRKNQNFMRKLNQIVSQLPIATKEAYEQHAFSEYSDIATINVLASVTKGFEMLSELQEDFKIISSKGLMEYGVSEDMGFGGGFGGMGDGDMMEMFAHEMMRNKQSRMFSKGGPFSMFR